MKVLKAPANTASQASITLKALRSLGVEVKGILARASPYTDDRGLEVVSTKWRGPRNIIFTSFWGYKLVKNLLWTDVLHWYSGKLIMPFELDLKLSKVVGKRFVEWMGSDIRIPEVEAEENPYYRKLLEEGKIKSSDKPKVLQRKFAEHGFSFLVTDSTEDYVLVEVPVYKISVRVDLSELKPRYPPISKELPLVVHASTNFDLKGTKAVLRAVDKAKEKVKFRFKLIHGLSRSEALSWIGKCDVFLDQFVLGHYGVAAVEAMALGKPVLGYIKESALEKYPDVPILNVTQENLSEKLVEVIRSPELMRELGIRGRRYAEEKHDSIKVARRLIEVYSS